MPTAQVERLRTQYFSALAANRQKIIDAIQAGEDPDAIAKRLDVKRQTVFTVCRAADVDCSKWSRKGFAHFTADKRRAVAQKGGRRAHKLGTAHRWTRKEAVAAAKLSLAVREGGK